MASPFDNISDITSLGLSTSSISALFLSVYNWLKARSGASLKLTESFRFGIFTYQSGRKHMYFPLDVMNTGNRIGKIDDIKYEFVSADGKKIELVPTRRVRVGSTEQLTPKNFEEILPTLPVFCPPDEGISEIFEYYEESKDGEIIQFDTEYKCRVSIRYDGNKKQSFDFKISITEQEWNTSGHSIKWINFIK